MLERLRRSAPAANPMVVGWCSRTAYADLPNTPPADAVRSLTFQAMRRLRDAGRLTPEQMTCFTRPRPKEELYDAEADPHELRNLASPTPQQPEVSRS